MTFDDWKEQCERVVEELELGFDDLWEEDDPYDLLESAEAKWETTTPHDFIHEMFDEDIAKRAHDEELFRESLEQEDE